MVGKGSPPENHLLRFFEQTPKVEAGGHPSVSGGMQVEEEEADTPLSLTSLTHSLTHRSLTERPQFNIDFTQCCNQCDDASSRANHLMGHVKRQVDNFTLDGGEG